MPGGECEPVEALVVRSGDELVRLGGVHILVSQQALPMLQYLPSDQMLISDIADVFSPTGRERIESAPWTHVLAAKVPL